jgi:DNA-directed RNA polymerase subunit RPC12/RpoP
MTIRICSTCSNQYDVEIHRQDDPPGHHWPSDMRPLIFPCGHENGVYDDEHEIVSFEQLKGERTILKCSECGNLQFSNWKMKLPEVCEQCGKDTFTVVGVADLGRRVFQLPRRILDNAPATFLDKIKTFEIVILP